MNREINQLKLLIKTDYLTDIKIQIILDRYIPRSGIDHSLLGP